MTPKCYCVGGESLVLGFDGRQGLLFLGLEHMLNTSEDPSGATFNSRIHGIMSW